MTQKYIPGRDGLGSQPSRQSTATSLASDRCGVSRAGGGQEAAAPAFEGAPPSNTAPYNCNDGYFKALRWGVDSLYLSYPGELSRESDASLKELKLLAQSTEPGEVAKAQLALGNHVFEVKEKGASLFPYIIEDAAFRIQLSRPGHKAPMAYVKVSAVFLAHVGPIEAEKQLYELLVQLGEIKESANVSRIDLFVDFQTSVNMESWDRHAWVTRASSINAYAVSGNFSGWSVGLGGIVSARLYNKLLEIVVSGKDWILPLWQKTGWTGEGVIWRLEFELKREVLTQKGISKLYQVLNHLNGLWSYATTVWLRLTLPSEDDQTRSRWPTHPLWDLLSSVDWEGDGGPLSKRFTPTRSPKDERLFQMACSVFFSFMAKHGFDAGQLYEANEDLIAKLHDYIEQKAYDQGLPFDHYVSEKLALKHRQYNSAINDPEQEAKRKAQELSDQARAYRKESDG
ncbi:MAG: replication initiation factor [Nitrosomonas ureae]